MASSTTDTGRVYLSVKVQMESGDHALIQIPHTLTSEDHKRLVDAVQALSAVQIPIVGEPA